MQFGNTRVLTLVPAIDTGAYTAGDCVGPLLEFDALGAQTNRGVLKTLTVTDDAAQAAALTFLFFREKPTGTFTNNSPNAISKADLQKVVAKVNVAADDYETINSKSIATIDVSQVVCGDPQYRKLFAVCVTTGTPTYASATDLKFTLGVLCD